MKSVLISINPKWCELIASGEKTVEVRKSRPKIIDVPFKCYIYETQALYATRHNGKFNGRGKVIGEFVCDDIKRVHCSSIEKETFYAVEGGNGDKEYYDNSCVSYKEAYKYLKDAKQAYAWHISDLVIYDTPKELSEFYKEDFDEVYSNWEDLFSIGVPTGCSVRYPPEPKKEDYVIKRPPQSWCYVEELEATK